MQFKLAFIGFGNVGRSLARLLLDQTAPLRNDYGVEWSLTGLASRRIGWLARASGMEVEQALQIQPEHVSAQSHGDIASWLAATEADVLFEMSSLDVAAGQPAIGYMAAALERGIHVVTANKGPIVHGYRHLQALGDAHGALLRFESTVMDGAPIFSLFRESLPLAHVASFEGIFNSTSNFILAEIEQGAGLDHAVARAQALGLAETDPAADVDGFDAAVKVAALAAVLMGTPLDPRAMARRGIRELDAEAVRAARRAGTPYKLMCRCVREGAGVVASVGPERVAADSPYAQVNGTSSIARFNTDMLPGITIVEHEPTPVTTAYGMLADFIGIARSVARRPRQSPPHPSDGG